MSRERRLTTSRRPKRKENLREGCNYACFTSGNFLVLLDHVFDNASRRLERYAIAARSS